MATTENVTSITDGDTFETNAHKYPNSIRLADVRAPEAHTTKGQAATQELTRLIGGKTVNVNVVAHDEYRRAVAQVYLGDVWVNEWMRRFIGGQ